MDLIKRLKEFGVDETSLDLYGKDIVKVDWRLAQDAVPKGKLVLVTAITPTPFGEGKTTVSIGLTDGLNSIGKKAIVALREPSLGPVFGRKGGATGGGATQVQPAWRINLHFTGDFHAITSAHNLIAAMIEQQLFFGKINIDNKKIVWRRAIDMNDRHLRKVTIEISEGISYEGGFQITASSEIMAILCLARNISELRQMLDDIIFAYDTKGKPLYVFQLGITDALIALLKDAFSPNVVFTSGGNLAFIHGGPFANIAHGCNSILATRLALSLADYTVTEAGFGSDLGAEKFLNIKAPKLGRLPDCIVLVATVRALKYHADIELSQIENENVAALNLGLANLKKHIENIKNRNIPIVVTINVFSADTEAELCAVEEFVSELEVCCVRNTAYFDGASGAKKLAECVVLATNEEANDYSALYNISDSLKVKVDKVAVGTYGATEVIYSKEAELELAKNKEKFDTLPICIVKTPNSFTLDAANRGIPKPFTAKVERFKLANGAKMVIVFMGTVIDMPGLPENPQAQKITVTKDYEILGVD